MNTFNYLCHLDEIIKAAKTHCIFLPPNKDPVVMLPVILVYLEYALDIPAYGPVPASTINRVHYVRKYITVFRYGTEYCGQEGKGMYGIGMYEESDGDRRWHCDSILFNENSCEPLLVQGRDAALQVAAEDIRSRDKSRARGNEDAIIEHGLIEASTLNAILGELLRAEPKTAPAMIGIRDQRVQLLLEGNEDGRYLCVPGSGFVCRDEAAGMILDQIVYAVDDAQREHPLEPESRQVFELTV